MSKGFAFIAFGFFVNMIGTTLPTPLYPIYIERYGWSPALVTIIFSAYAIAVIAGLLFFGHQSDRAGRKPVLLVGLGLSAVSAIAFIVAHDLGIVLAARVLSGLSAGVFTGAGTAAMVDYAPHERRRDLTLFAIIVNVGGLGFGTLISGLAASYLPDPLRVPYVIDLALLIPAFAGVLAAPETIRNPSGALGISVQRLRVPVEIRRIFWQASIAGVCAFAVSGVFSAVAPEFLGAHLGVHSPFVAGALVFVLMELSALGQMAVNRIRKSTVFQTGCIVMIVGLGLLAGSIELRSVWMLFLSAAASGFGQGVVMGFGLANINERIAERRGEVTSAYFVLLYAGLALPVVAVGFLAGPMGLGAAGVLFSGVVGLTVVAVIRQFTAA